MGMIETNGVHFLESIKLCAIFGLDNIVFDSRTYRCDLTVRHNALNKILYLATRKRILKARTLENPNIEAVFLPK